MQTEQTPKLINEDHQLWIDTRRTLTIPMGYQTLIRSKVSAPKPEAPSSKVDKILQEPKLISLKPRPNFSKAELAKQRLEAPVVQIYDFLNYLVGEKEAKLENDQQESERWKRWRTRHAEKGCRHVVEAVLVVHDRGHPSVLHLQIGNAFFKLPGGKLRENEDEIACLKRKLDNKLAPLNPEYKVDWEIISKIGTWYRPAFESAVYPYRPPHIVDIKEIKTRYLVQLPPKAIFGVPKNFKLTPIPLFDLYENSPKLGVPAAALPLELSRFEFTAIPASPSTEKARQKKLYLDLEIGKSFNEQMLEMERKKAKDNTKQQLPAREILVAASIQNMKEQIRVGQEGCRQNAQNFPQPPNILYNPGQHCHQSIVGNNSVPWVKHARFTRRY